MRRLPIALHVPTMRDADGAMELVSIKAKLTVKYLLCVRAEDFVSGSETAVLLGN